jgi:hypothetical protein
MALGRPRVYADNASRQRAYRQRQAAGSSPTAALMQACATPDPEGETWQAFIARIGLTLSAAERQRDALEWTTARLIVAAERAARVHPERPRGRPAQVRRHLLQDLRQWWEQTHLPHPRPTWLTQALRVAAMAPHLFADTDTEAH